MLFSRQEQPEDHGYGLVEEFEDYISSIRERVASRTDTVRSRLASLEDELSHLTGLSDKLDK